MTVRDLAGAPFSAEASMDAAAGTLAETGIGRHRGSSVRDVWEQHVLLRPEHPFLVWIDPDTDATTQATYAAFDRSVNQIANALLSRGVVTGDRVVVHQGNTAEFVGCFLAATKIGAVVVPLGPDSTAPECDEILARCEPKLLVTGVDLLAGIRRGALDRIGSILVTGTADTFADPSPEVGLFSVAIDAESGEDVICPRPRETDLAEIMFTSGTTSRPKGVMLTHANLVFAGEYVNWELGMTGDDRYLTAMLVTHANFQMSALLPVITCGGTLILARRYSASRYWREAREHGATLVQGMAMIARTMLLQPPAPQETDHHVRLMHYFMPMTDAEKEAFEQRFRVRILNNYGSTETLAGVITDTPGDSRWPSIGRVGPGYRASVVDCDGRPVAPGEIGEIVIGGTPGLSLMCGYWNDPDSTAAVLSAGGCFRTGDFGSVDDDGWFTFVGRAGDLIKSAGQTVSTAEVESVLRRHPAVDDAAVVGVVDPIRDALIAAFVVARPGADLDLVEVRRFCSENLAPFKIPARIELVAELPTGHYGKVRKDQLIQQTRKAR